MPASVPFSASVPTVSLNAPMSSVAPVATVTAAASASRSDAPSISVPALTVTVVAAAVPFSAETPPAWVSVPAPRFAFTVAAFSVYEAAVSVPVPASVPFSASVPTVSVKPPMSSVDPVATVTAAASARRSFAPSASVPALTFTVAAAAVPFSAELPPAWVSVPVPRFAFTTALFSV